MPDRTKARKDSAPVKAAKKTAKKAKPQATAAPVEGTATNGAAPAQEVGSDLSSIGEALLPWLVGTDRATFFADIFERRFAHVQHGAAHFAAGSPGAERGDLLPQGVEWSTERMRDAVAGGHLRHGTDLNIVRFDTKLQQRVALKTSGIVGLGEYEAALREGWSVRFLRPQEHVSALSRLLFLFDECFACNAGMNSYWTPANSQGFAPHYDDVDVFMLQLEGHKRWRLYDPPTEAEWLARTSSRDYTHQDMGKPKATVVLGPGDVLYLPRGQVHQGDTLAPNNGSHSLHVTLSACQMHTLVDLVEDVVKKRLEAMATEHQALREALRPEWFRAVGTAFNRGAMGPHALAPSQPARDAVLAAVRQWTAQLSTDVAAKAGPIDRGADVFAERFLRRRQPPPPVDEDAAAAAAEDRSVRLRARHAARLTLEGEEAVLHHCGANSVVCLGPPSAPTYLRFEMDFAPAMAHIIAAFPKAVPLADVPFPSAETDEEAAEDAATLCAALVETGAFEWC